MSQKALVVCPHCGTSFQVDVTTTNGEMSRPCPKCHKSAHITVRQSGIYQVRK